MSSTQETEESPSVANDSPSVARFGIKHLMLFVAVICVVVAFFHRPIVQSINNQGHGGWKRASAFTDVRVEDGAVFVEFNNSSYQLISINGASTERLLKAARYHFGSLGEKRFIEDLPEVLGAMGMKESDTVDLVLQDGDGEQIRFPDAPMTAQNRSLVYRNAGKRTTPRGSDAFWPMLLTIVAILLFSLAKDLRRFLLWRRKGSSSASR